MNSKMISRTILLLLLGVSLLWAGDPWKEKPWTEWTEKQVKKVLTDSPWCKTKPIRSVIGWDAGAGGSRPATEVIQIGPPRHGAPTGGIPGPKYGAASKTLILWASSLTIREALAREGELSGTMTEKQATQLVVELPRYYVIIVHGHLVYSTLWKFSSEKTLRESAYLRPKRSKQKIIPVQVKFIRSSTDATDVAVAFHFPREREARPTISPKEKKVEFHWVLYDRKIKTTFELRKMVRDGKPDL